MIFPASIMRAARRIYDKNGTLKREIYDAPHYVNWGHRYDSVKRSQTNA